MADDQYADPWNPTYPLASGLSKLAAKADEFLRKPFGYDNPPGAIASEVLGLPGFSRIADKIAYGDTRLLENSARGRQDRTDFVEAIPLAAGAAKLWAKGAMRGAKALGRQPLGQTQMFLGPQAKSADLDKLARAESLEVEGKPTRYIWEETGWLKGPDGKWRFEIPDDKAKFAMLPKVKERNRKIQAKIDIINDALDFHEIKTHYAFDPKRREEAIQKFKELHEGREPSDIALGYADNHTYEELANILDVNAKFFDEPLTAKLSDVLEHDELYQAYPVLKEMPITVRPPRDPEMEGIGGYYSSRNGRASTGDPHPGEVHLANSALDPEGVHGKSVTLHEVQHAIQNREGFDPGASREGILKARNAEYENAVERAEYFQNAVTMKQLMDENPGMRIVDAYNTMIDRAMYMSKQPSSEMKKLLLTGTVYDDLASLKYNVRKNIERAQKAKTISKDQAHDLYMRNMGETEARATQHRAHMNRAEREWRYPLSSYDRPVEDLMSAKDLYDPYTPAKTISLKDAY